MLIKILRKRWWLFTLIAAISGWILNIIYYILPIEQQTDAISYALIGAYLVGMLAALMGQIVGHKRPGNLRVYKITKDSDEFTDYEEITPIK